MAHVGAARADQAHGLLHHRTRPHLDDSARRIVAARLTSQLFLGPPAASDGALDHEAPASDELFAADKAEDWAAIRAREGETASAPFCETARQLFTPSAAAAAVKSMDHTSLGRQALVGACLGVALSTRASRSPNDFAHDRDPSHLIPLARALQTAMLAAPTQLNDDPFSSAVSIQACWIHILADIRLIEISNGRDGLAAMRRASNADRDGPDDAGAREALKPWAKSPRARRALIHGIDIFNRAKSLALGQEVSPLLQAAVWQVRNALDGECSLSRCTSSVAPAPTRWTAAST